MGKFLTVLALLGAAGFCAFVMATGAVIHYDVTSVQHPLGSFADADGWLKGYTYEVEPVDEDSGNGPEGAKRHRYKETYGGDSGHFLCYVDLYVDGGGSVRMLVADFASRSKVADPAYTTSQGLVYGLWEALSGSPPTFRGDDITKQAAIGLRSDLDSGGVKATWLKVYSNGDRDHSIVDTVTFVLK